MTWITTISLVILTVVIFLLVFFSFHFCYGVYKKSVGLKMKNMGAKV